MSIVEPSQARILVVESAPFLHTVLLALLAEEGYFAIGSGSLEQALQELERQAYDLILADLYAGVSKHSFAPAHLLRRRAQPIPLGLITTQTRVLKDPQAAGFAFALSRPLDVSRLFTEIAASLKQPLMDAQQHQAQVLEQFLAAWSLQAWRSMLNLCTEEITCYPSSLFPLPAGTHVQGKLAVLSLATSIRRRYQSLRIETPQVYLRPHGLSARILGYSVEEGKSWRSFSSAALFAFEGERICQIGLPLAYQDWKGLLEPPDAFFSRNVSS